MNTNIHMNIHMNNNHYFTVLIVEMVIVKKWRWGCYWYIDNMKDEGVSIDHSTDGEVEDGSDFSYGSEYEDEVDEYDKDNEDDEESVTNEI